MCCLLTCLRMFLRGSCSWAGEGERGLLARVQETLWTIIKQVQDTLWTIIKQVQDKIWTIIKQVQDTLWTIIKQEQEHSGPLSNR